MLLTFSDWIKVIFIMLVSYAFSQFIARIPIWLDLPFKEGFRVVFILMALLGSTMVSVFLSKALMTTEIPEKALEIKQGENPHTLQDRQFTISEMQQDCYDNCEI